MKMPSLLFRLVVVASIFSASFARAATETWTGGGGSGNLFWLSTVNWNPASVPQAGDSLVFTNTVGLVNSNNISGGSFNSITFATPSGAFSLNGTSATITGGITNQQPYTPESITFPIALSGSVVANLVSNAILNLNNVISGSGSLTVSGAGTVNLFGSNTFSGGLTVTGGAAAVNQDTNLGVGNIVLNGGALQSMINFGINPSRNLLLGPTSGSGSGTLNVTSGTTFTNGAIMANNGGGTGGLTKVGFGNLVLFGANTYTGATTNTIGNMILDFTQPSAPANNIINSASSLSLGSGNSGLTAVNFAELLMAGKLGSANSQSFASANFLRGASVIIATNAGGGTANLALGALSHTPGSAVKFVTSAQTGGGNITTTSGNIGGILGGWATISGDANTPSIPSNNLITGTNYAAVDLSGNIVNFLNYFAVNAANSNILLHATVDANTTGVATNILVGDAGGGAIVARIDVDGAGTTTDINSIKFFNSPSTGGAGVLIGKNNTLRLGVYGGILSVQTQNTTPVVGGVSNMVNGITANQAPFGSQDVGTLTAGGTSAGTPGEIVITHYTTQGETTGGLIVAARIADNGPGGTVTVVKMGNGSIKLDGNNTYSGGLYMLEGRVQWQGTEIFGTGNGGPGGTNGINDGAGYGPVYVLPGAYFAPSTSIPNITNDFFVAGVGNAQENFGVFRAGNFGGSINLIGDAAFCSDAANIFGPIHGPFNLTLGAPGRKGTLSLANTNNDWTGNTFMATRSDVNVLISSNSEVIPNGFGKGNVIMTNSAAANGFIWNMNGFSETVNGLLTSPNFAGTCIISNGLAYPLATLTVGDNDQSGTFGGILKSNIALAKIGAGVETFTNVEAYAGNTTISNGVLQLTGAGSIVSSPTVNINGGTFDVSAGNYLVPSQTINVNGGTLFISTATASTPLTFNNGTLKVGTLTAGANLTVNSTLNVSGANFIQPANMPLIPAYPVTYPVIKYTTLSGSPTFSAVLPGGGFPPFGGFISNDNATATIYLVLTNGPVTPSLTWFGFSGGTVNSTWDFAANDWTNKPAHTLASYTDGSLITFDDGGLTNVVNLTTIFQPAGVTVTNSGLTYTFVGSGAISGTNGLTKFGAGKLILDNTGGDSYSGGMNIVAGTVQVGKNDTGGSLGAPNNNVGNNGLLIFNRTDSIAISNSISGSGSLLVSNASGTTVTLQGNNSFGGPATFVTGLRIVADNSTAFGTTNGNTTIPSGSTLDVSAPDLGLNGLTMPEPFIISGDGTDGNGAIINNGANGQNNALQRVTLAGNTSVSGSARFDIRSATGYLSTGGNNYNLTKKGANQISLVGLTVDPALGNVDVQAGTLSVETTTTGLGNVQSNLTVAASAGLQVFQLANPLNKNIILAGNANLTSGSGTNTISGPLTLNGTVSVFVNSARGILNLTGVKTGTGGLLSRGTNTLVISGNDNYSGGLSVDEGTLILNGINSNTGNALVENTTTLGFTTVVGGNGTNAGPATINSVLHPGISGHPSTFGSGSLSVAPSGTLILDLGSSTTIGGGVNDLANVIGDVDGFFSAQILVNPIGLLSTNGAYTAVAYTGNLNSFFSSTVDVVPAAKPSRYTISPDFFSTPGKVLLNVTTGAGSMVWSNAQGNGIWDIANTKNWLNQNHLGGLVDPNDYQFFQGDVAVLNDFATGLGTTLTITNALTNGIFPAFIVCDATANYTITGSGKLTSGTSIIKRNTGTLTFSNMVNNDFTGTTLISAGTVKVDFGTELGALSGGAVTITNGGTLDIGGNTTANSFGFTNTVGDQKAFIVSGWGVSSNGAIVNSSAVQQLGAFQKITLAGDAAFGGPGLAQGNGNPGRWDMRGTNVTLSTGGNAYNLYKVGSNQVSLVGTTVDAALADIRVMAGEFGVETTTSPTLGNPNNTLTVDSGASFEFFNFVGPFNKKLVANGGSTLSNTFNIWFNSGPGYPTNTIASLVTLTNGLVSAGGAGNGSFSNVISGPGGLAVASGTVSLDATNTYTGSTVVSNATLALRGNASIASTAIILTATNSTLNASGRANSTLTLASSQTLSGLGTVNGSLSNAVGSTVSPGLAGIGNLTVTNGNVSLKGTAAMDLNKSVAPSNDVLVVSGNVTYGGTLSLNITGSLAAGDNFKLFSAGTYGGAFSSLSPSTPGAGLAWNTNNLAINGTLSVISASTSTNRLTSFTLSGTTLSFSATNGPASGSWTLLSSTNVALRPFSAWTTVTNGTFDVNGNASFTGANLVNPAKTETFYILQQ